MMKQNELYIIRKVALIISKNAMMLAFLFVICFDFFVCDYANICSILAPTSLSAFIFSKACNLPLNGATKDNLYCKSQMNPFMLIISVTNPYTTDTNAETISAEYMIKMGFTI